VRQTLQIQTHEREELVDITDQVKQAVAHSGIDNGLVSVYAKGATAAIMIQEEPG